MATQTMMTIRLLRDVLARNIIESCTLYTGEEFLARFQYGRWAPHLGPKLPRGHQALLVFGDSGRIATGEAIVIGVQGVDWAVTGHASVT